MNTKYSKFEILRMRIADLRGRGVYSGYPNAHCCVFIHIPKAAGTSLTRTLFDSPSRHLHYTEYERRKSSEVSGTISNLLLFGIPTIGCSRPIPFLKKVA